MAKIVVLGAGLGGVIAALELRAACGKQDEVTMIGQGDRFVFVPSNPWVAVGWRKRAEVEVELTPIFRRMNIAFHTQGASRVDPAAKTVALTDGVSVPYDYLVLATGPELAFDEVPGPRPRWPHPLDLPK